MKIKTLVIDSARRRTGNTVLINKGYDLLPVASLVKNVKEYQTEVQVNPRERPESKVPEIILPPLIIPDVTPTEIIIYPIPRLLSVTISNDNVIRRYNLREDLHFRSNLSYSGGSVPKATTAVSDFSMLIDSYEYDKNEINLSYDARRSATIENAGGKSVVSEMLSIEYFRRVFNSNNTLLEMEIEYWAKYKMVDYITTIQTLEGEERVGVSVTRAMGFPTPEDFETSDAERLINKKLYGLIVARNAVQRKQRFFRSVLHVWCQTRRIAEMVSEAYERIENKDYGMEIQGTVSILLTICPEESLYNDDLSGYNL